MNALGILRARGYVQLALVDAKRLIRESATMSDETLSNAVLQDVIRIRDKLEAAMEALGD